MLCPGQVYETTLTVQNAQSPPSTATLVITKLADGTSETHTGPWTWAASGADQVTSYDYLLPAAGQYKFTWSTTGPGTAPVPDIITVRDFISLVSKAEAKAHLNITTSTNDDELSQFMMAATELVEAKGGYTIRRAVTDQVSGSTAAVLTVPRMPVLSVTSVTSVWTGGPSWATADLRWDGPAGIVYQPSGAGFWYGPWNIVYEVGRVVPLEKHLHACKEQVRHLWETQRGAMPPSVLGGEETYTTSFGMTFSVPRRVLELLEDETMPAI